MSVISRRYLPGIAGLIVLLCSGVVQGVWVGRWQSSDAPAQLAARLDRVPKTVGRWKQIDERSLDPQALKQAEISGYLHRRYLDEKGGAQVTLLLLCGKPGPISVHPPTACYQGAGYQLIGSPLRHYLAEDAESDATSSDKSSTQSTREFYLADFHKPLQLGARPIRIWWTWSTDGNWRVPDNPRLTFASSPALVKMYVIEETSPDASTIEESAAADFIRNMLPLLRKTIFSTPH